MTVLDACAVIALFRDEPAAAAVQGLLREGARLTATSLAEVLDQLVRLLEVPEREAVLDVAELDLHDPPALTAVESQAAGLLRARHYHRLRRPVSLADCVAAAVARRTAQELATSDPHLLALCTEEGITVHPLPDSAGRVWSNG